ncbi:MAG: hypothetical protein U5L96_10965 [Owenweeksia sp.]|nr:hypothetical protein [Owenweeksia sp.]
MDLKERAKGELDTRLKNVEDFIAKRGMGSSYLQRAQKVQRNANLALVLTGVITVAGVLVWALRKDES